MTGPKRGAIAIVPAAILGGALTLAACGETYLEASATTLPRGAPVVTLAPIAPDAPVDELLSEIETLLFDLDERIVDRNAPGPTLERIEALWDVAEPQIGEDDPDAAYQFEQALALARTGVNRKRPADASKSYKLIQQLIDAYQSPQPG